jgi:hypothetical protein
VVGGGHDEQDLVDSGSAVDSRSAGEGRDAVLDEGLAVKSEQLLGQSRTEPAARAAAKYDRHHVFHRHICGLYPVCQTPVPRWNQR